MSGPSSHANRSTGSARVSRKPVSGVAVCGQLAVARGAVRRDVVVVQGWESRSQGL